MRKRYTLPNLITIAGIISATFAVAFSQHVYVATGLIIISALTDYLDGKIARRLGQVSAIGSRLDAIHDVLAFGLAPVAILWRAFLPVPDIQALLAGGLYVLAALFRIAREQRRGSPTTFLGLPSSFAALLLLAMLHLFSAFSEKPEHATSIVLTAMLVISALMISNVVIKRPF